MKTEFDYVIYADGGARGNPGPAAYGFVIYNSDGVKIYGEGGKIGKTTNNVAEYSAVISALKWLSEQSIIHNEQSIIKVFLDSQLVTEQLSGRWKIKNENLRNLFFTVKNLEQKIGAKFTYTHILREKNREADTLVNMALDGEI